MSPRSLLLTPNIAGPDGISSLSRQIARALPQPVIALSLHDDRAAAPAGIAVRGASGSRTRFIAAAARLAVGCTRTTTIVCVHLHLAAVARFVAWRGAPMTVVLCGIEAWLPLRPTERWALARAELVAISEHTVVRFKAANPDFADRPVRVVHPGLPPASSECGAARPGKAALIVGRMAANESYKGHDELIDVWPRVLDRHPNAELWIVGDGTDRPRLESRAAAAGLLGRIRFTGRVDDPTLDRLYRECSFFVMPSRDEGFGLVFLEAMRAGKACIGAPGAAAEIIRDGETGLIVDPTDRARLADAIVRLFDRPEVCRELGAAGEARFRSLFTDAAFRRRLAIQ